jgi:calcium binding protein 39
MHKNIHSFVTYMSSHFQSILTIAEGYSHPDIALNSGSMLRECLRYEELAHKFLYSSQLWLFFDSFVHLPNFDVASDAFNTLRELLIGQRYKQIVSQFLSEKYDIVFTKYEVIRLLLSLIVFLESSE